MARLSIIERNDKRKETVNKTRKVRAELKEQLRKLRHEQNDLFDQLMLKLHKRPRDESKTRVRNRCRSCGRSHGTYQKFGLCRLCLRKVAMQGHVPGLKKASW